MEIIKFKQCGRVMVPGEYLFINDKPRIFDVDGGFWNIHFDWDDSTGTFMRPSGMFGMPHVGDLLDVKMKSGKVLRCVVTYWTQDWDIAKGTLHIISYVEDYAWVIECNQRPKEITKANMFDFNL